MSHIVELGELTEMAVNEQIMDHFLQYNLFHPNIHRSVPNHDVVTAHAQLQEMLLEAAESKEIRAMILLDQRPAYDLVDHSIFLGKMKIYNCSPNTLKWLKSYLSDRPQMVQIGSQCSKPLILGGVWGTPRVSIGAPDIFD